MTTVTIDLERVLASGKKNSYEGRAFAEVVSCVARSKRVVCLTGAGISTSAGIPDFRSKEGLYKLAGEREPTLSPSKSSRRPTFTRSPSSSTSSSSYSSSSSSSSLSSSTAASSLKGADLFSTQVFQSAASLSKFYKFISNLNTLSASAQPTPTHSFIRTLSKKGKLLRVYTQNIDGLEERVGLVSANPSDFIASGTATIQPASASSSKGKGKAKYSGDLVHLHGRAALVRCTVCTYSGAWTDEISEAYEGGYSVRCYQCQERLSLRKALGKRLNVAVGSLRPAITLYGEQGMEDLFISEISNADIGSKPDCLIIFGTSLKVHGFKQLAKDFAREVEENDGKVIYVNLGEPGREWDSSISFHVQGHSDTFVQAVLEQWKHIRPQDFQTQSKLSSSDFQATKSKVAVSTKVKKAGPPFEQESGNKRKREDQVVVPVSPSKAPRKRSAKYEDDDDYEVPLRSTSSKKSPLKTEKDLSISSVKLRKDVSSSTLKLPSFKKISTPSPADKKKPNSVSPPSLPSLNFDSESCDLRSSDEDAGPPAGPSAKPSGIAASSLRKRGTPTSIAASRKRPKMTNSTSTRSSRVRDDFIVSDSEQESGDADFDNISLIAEMDSDDDEDTVYVRSSTSPTVKKVAPIGNTSKRKCVV